MKLLPEELIRAAVVSVQSAVNLNVIPLRARAPDRFGGKLAPRLFARRQHCFKRMARIQVHGVWGNVAKPIAVRFVCVQCGEIEAAHD